MAIGFVNNQKNFCGSTDSSGETISYIGKTKTVSNGSQFVIEVWSGKENNLAKRGEIIPEIPYRLMWYDAEPLDTVRSSLINQPTGANGLLFNPGITVVNNALSFVGSGAGPYKEYNFSRKELSILQRPQNKLSSDVVNPPDNWFIWQALGNNSIIINPYSINAYDLATSMVVRNVNTLLDYLYISIDTRVVINSLARHTTLKSNNNHVECIPPPIDYTIPIVMRLAINRSVVTSQDKNKSFNLFPDSWAYCVPAFGKITNTTSTEDVSLYNYGYIPTIFNQKYIVKRMLVNPGVQYISYNNTAYELFNWYKPQTWGCLSDLDYHDSNNEVSTTCVRGKIPTQGVITQELSLRSYSWVSNEYVIGSDHKNINGKFAQGMEVNTSVDKVQITVNQITGYIMLIWAGRMCKTTSYQGLTNFMLLDSGYNYQFNIPAICGYPSCFAKDSTFQISCNHTSNPYSFFESWNLPTIDAAYIALVNSQTGYMRPNTFESSLNMTKVFSFTTNYILGSIYKSIISNYTFLKSDISRYISDTCPDKSSIPITHSNFSKVIDYQIVQVSGDFDVLQIKTIDPLGTTEYRYIDDGISNINDNTVALHNKQVSIGSDTNGKTLIATLDISNDLISDIKLYDPGQFVLGPTITGYYWNNPTFDITPETEGIYFTIECGNNSGIFASVPITLDAYDRNLVGISIDTDRSFGELEYDYVGNYQTYVDRWNTTRQGYGANLKNKWEISLTYNDTELISRKAGPLHFWNYSDDGLFSIVAPVYLDLDQDGFPILDALNRTWEDTDFVLEDVEMKLKIYDSFNMLTVNATGLMNIDPPDPTVTMSTSHNKSITSANWTWTRDSTKGSQTWSTIRDMRIDAYNANGTLIETRALESILGYDISTGTIVYDFGSGGRKGDSVTLQYKPMLYDRKSFNIPIKESEPVTYVLGHHYSIGDVTISLDSVDKTSEIQQGEPYIYIAPGADVTVDVTYSIDNEDWSTTNDPSGVYPYIKNIYLVAVPVDASFSRTDYYKAPEKITTTYPNHNQAFGTVMINIYNDLISTQLVDKYIAPTTDKTSLAVGDADLQITIDSAGKWQIYLIVEDEFDQRSAFCVTNIRNKYNIPFRSV